MRAVLVIALGSALIGCSAYHSLPDNWHEQIPGRYEGTHSSFKEVLAFRPDGLFTHQLFDGTNLLFSEGGRWNVEPGRFEINLEPTKSFTQFYDPMTRTFSPVGGYCVGYKYSPLPEGTTFSKISAAVEFEYCLVRVSTNAIPRDSAVSEDGSAPTP